MYPQLDQTDNLLADALIIMETAALNDPQVRRRVTKFREKHADRLTNIARVMRITDKASALWIGRDDVDDYPTDHQGIVDLTQALNDLPTTTNYSDELMDNIGRLATAMRYVAA